jgi:hypothetical protein
MIAVRADSCRLWELEELKPEKNLQEISFPDTLKLTQISLNLHIFPVNNAKILWGGASPLLTPRPLAACGGSPSGVPIFHS